MRVRRTQNAPFHAPPPLTTRLALYQPFVQLKRAWVVFWLEVKKRARVTDIRTFARLADAVLKVRVPPAVVRQNVVLHKERLYPKMRVF